MHSAEVRWTVSAGTAFEVRLLCQLISKFGLQRDSQGLEVQSLRVRLHGLWTEQRAAVSSRHNSGCGRSLCMAASPGGAAAGHNRVRAESWFRAHA